MESPASPVVRLPAGGTLRGVARANSSTFLGIRYAVPPTGALRFRPLDERFYSLVCVP